MGAKREIPEREDAEGDGDRRVHCPTPGKVGECENMSHAKTM